MAEKKRRDAIREGYDNLADLGTIQNIFLLQCESLIILELQSIRLNTKNLLTSLFYLFIHKES